MAVRSFMSIMEAHQKARDHAMSIGKTVFQSRQHAPPAPSFNGRGKRDLIVDPAPPVFSTITHPRLVGMVADDCAAVGLITPQQRYNIAMQQDIG